MIDRDALAKIAPKSPYPVALMQSGFVTFQSADEVAAIFGDVGRFVLVHSVPLMEFVESGYAPANIKRQDASNVAHSMFRQAWNSYCRKRGLAPHALASDGLRWHARAYCFLHEDYRDFVLTRMAVAGSGKALTQRQAGALPLDQEWNNVVELDLVPAAKLGETQAAAIRREYGFKGKVLAVRVRQALLFYAIRRWGLDRADSRLVILEQRIIQTDGKK